MMDNIFNDMLWEGYKFLIIYMDDILIYLDSLETLWELMK